MTRAFAGESERKNDKRTNARLSSCTYLAWKNGESGRVRPVSGREPPTANSCSGNCGRRRLRLWHGSGRRVTGAARRGNAVARRVFRCGIPAPDADPRARAKPWGVWSGHPAPGGQGARGLFRGRRLRNHHGLRASLSRRKENLPGARLRSARRAPTRAPVDGSWGVRPPSRNLPGVPTRGAAHARANSRAAPRVGGVKPKGEIRQVRSTPCWSLPVGCAIRSHSFGDFIAALVSLAATMEAARPRPRRVDDVAP